MNNDFFPPDMRLGVERVAAMLKEMTAEQEAKSAKERAERTEAAQRNYVQFLEDPAGWQPNQMYVDELAHFIGCLDEDEMPALDVFDAARVLDIALAAKESSRVGRVVIFEEGM
jgi:hypothetical protein